AGWGRGESPSSGARTWLSRRNAALPRSELRTSTCASATGAAAGPPAPPMTPSLSRVPSRKFRRHLLSNYDHVVAWYNRSDLAGTRRLCCSNGLARGWSVSGSSPQPGSYACTDDTDFRPDVAAAHRHSDRLYRSTTPSDYGDSQARCRTGLSGVSPGQRSGGCGIRTREGLPPTRFPNVRLGIHARPERSVTCDRG